MGDFTICSDHNDVESIISKPRNTTLDLVKQFARVYTPITTIAFSQLISN